MSVYGAVSLRGRDNKVRFLFLNFISYSDPINSLDPSQRGRSSVLLYNIFGYTVLQYVRTGIRAPHILFAPVHILRFILLLFSCL